MADEQEKPEEQEEPAVISAAQFLESLELRQRAFELMIQTRLTLVEAKLERLADVNTEQQAVLRQNIETLKEIFEIRTGIPFPKPKVN